MPDTVFVIILLLIIMVIISIIRSEKREKELLTELKFKRQEVNELQVEKVEDNEKLIISNDRVIEELKGSISKINQLLTTRKELFDLTIIAFELSSVLRRKKKSEEDELILDKLQVFLTTSITIKYKAKQ